MYTHAMCHTDRQNQRLHWALKVCEIKDFGDSLKIQDYPQRDAKHRSLHGRANVYARCVASPSKGADAQNSLHTATARISTFSVS